MYQFIILTVCLSVRLSSICPSFCLSVWLSIYLYRSVCFSICVNVCLSLRHAVCLPVCLYLCLSKSVCHSVILSFRSTVFLSVLLFLCLPVTLFFLLTDWLSVCLSVYLHVSPLISLSFIFSWEQWKGHSYLYQDFYHIPEWKIEISCDFPHVQREAWTLERLSPQMVPPVLLHEYGICSVHLLRSL